MCLFRFYYISIIVSKLFRQIPYSGIGMLMGKAGAVLLTGTLFFGIATIVEGFSLWPVLTGSMRWFPKHQKNLQPQNGGR
ncbi:hypothetical protein [Paenibacillus donghaensis]|uniref:Uncharacterized protein n=1 Tax=Paenibacillus donghaensis TaxID=414771 RepID=A0A2Z2KPG1_9BACL|nr:hypothetical protein [Paenibacillus donghaensis]ASA23192.1 hypothetical protein B9T62_21725 [Paenibacillus donghaensis]